MNIYELNSIADNIRAVDSRIVSTNLRPAVEYIASKHNEFIGILRQVYEFVLSNIDIFENPKGGWKDKSRNRQYSENYQIGTENIYNCVIRDFHYQSSWKNENRVYWVDGGIIFRVSDDLKKIYYLSDCDSPSQHGYGDNARMWNDSYDFTKFNCIFKVRINGHDTIGDLYHKGDIVWDESMWDADKMMESEWDEFRVKELKQSVEEDLAHAERIVDRLAYTMQMINASVMDRQAELNKSLDESEPKNTVKYTIEISKVE